MTEEAPVVRTPGEDARPSTTEATAMVQTGRKEEYAEWAALQWVNVITRDLHDGPE